MKSQSSVALGTIEFDEWVRYDRNDSDNNKH